MRGADKAAETGKGPGFRSLLGTVTGFLLTPALELTKLRGRVPCSFPQSGPQAWSLASAWTPFCRRGVGLAERAGQAGTVTVRGKGAHAGGLSGGSNHGHPGDSRGAQSGALVRRRRGLREPGEGEAIAPRTRAREGLASLAMALPTPRWGVDSGTLRAD